MASYLSRKSSSQRSYPRSRLSVLPVFLNSASAAERQRENLAEALSFFCAQSSRSVGAAPARSGMQNETSIAAASNARPT
jgi:hypothetical protein